MANEGILYWITGLAGAGKTTIGNRLFYELRKKKPNVIILDGDVLKNLVNDTPGYSDAERRNRAMKYAMLCKNLTNQGIIVICCTIAMYDEVRTYNRQHNKGYIEVFLDVPVEVLKKRDQKGMYSQFESGKVQNLAGFDVQVEFPKDPDLVLKNDGTLTVGECVEEILKLDARYTNDFDRDTQYWNEYYSKNLALEIPSPFAEFVGGYLEKGKSLLELGCGNGRDSLFFASMGIEVTGIDTSDATIENLNLKTDMENCYFICDDFVCSPALFVTQFDYCYSRFSIHAINEAQEIEVMRNVYGALKQNGKFFIETRSINDDLFGKGEKAGENAYIYDGHYRRFIVKEDLEKNALSAGFHILYSEENRGFAPLGDVDPPIIRMILQKGE